MFDNRKPKTCSTLFSRTGTVHTIKTFEDSIQSFRWNTRPVVPHGNFHQSIFRAGTNDNLPILLSIFDGIVDQVRKHLLNPLWISINPPPFGDNIIEVDVLLTSMRR